MAQRRRSTSSSLTTKSVLGYPDYLEIHKPGRLPRHGTMRNFERPTYGPRVEAVAQLLLSNRRTRKGLLPHQRYIADVMGEVDPKTGLLYYNQGLITFSRQGGKTTLVRVIKAHRAVDIGHDEPQTILFAAQDGNEAKLKWLEHANALLASPLGGRIKPGQPITSNGKEILEWSNGSSERPISSRPSSGHGASLDLGVITEGFSQTDYRYEDTMLPAMRARSLIKPGAQFWAESTAGTAESIYWNERIEAERARFVAEPQEPHSNYRTAIFDWSIDIEQDDPAEEETWWKATPALDLLISRDTIRGEFAAANTPAKLRAFYRSALNVTDRGAVAGTVFEEGAWEATGSDDAMIVGARAIALDIAVDRSWASIGWAGRTAAGRIHAEVIAHERGTHWILPYLVEKARRNGVEDIAVVSGSAAAENGMLEAMERAGLRALVLSKADYAAATAAYYDGITGRTMTHLATGQAPLQQAVEGAAFSIGELRVWAPLRSTTIISPLVSVTAAVRAFQIQQENDYDVLASVG